VICEVRNAIREGKSSIIGTTGTPTTNLATVKFTMAYVFRRLTVCEMKQKYLAEM
jgi:hypothetical protein